MKTKIFFSLFLSFIFYVLSSQVPQGFNYQAIARNGSGDAIINTTIKVKVSILSDTTGFYLSGAGTYLWEEEHVNVKTNDFGLFTIVIGDPLATKIQGTAPAFNSINWAPGPLYFGIKVANPGVYKTMGAAGLWSVPYSMLSGGLDGALNKLEVVGEDISSDEALFEVKRKDGQTMFAVYNHGVRVFMPLDTLSKGRKGGFAIGGFDKSKGTVQNYFVVNPDSIRAYINTSTGKGKKGGFAIGGFDRSKGGNENYFNVSPDSSGSIYPSNRILWYPLKNALLTGRVIAENKDSVGENSFASGYESRSKGKYSQALGYQAIARGENSTSIGYQSVANKPNSFALGQWAQARNEESYAFGKGAIAEGFRSFAFGSSGIDSVGKATGVAYAKGDYSFAFGQGSVSTGFGAVSFGLADTAAGDFSLAMGYLNSAKNIGSTAFGLGTISSGYASFSAGLGTVSSGFNSFASGYCTVASGGQALSIGLWTNASGNASTALGGASESKGMYSVAMGHEAVSIGDCSFSLGRLTKTNNTYSYAMGIETSTNGFGSFSLGWGTQANGTVSFALGHEAVSVGNCSFSLGRLTKTNSDYSYAMGIGSISNGICSMAFGNYTMTKGYYSAAFGNGSIAIGNSSFVSGYSDKAKPYASFVIGQFNDTTCSANGTSQWISTDALFIAGNGISDNARANALTLYKNGNMTIAGTLTQNSDIRLKRNIIPIRNGLELIENLNPVYFNFKDTATYSSSRQIGFIAQEVREVMPELVLEDGRGYLSIDYSKISVILLQAVKEQQNQIELQQHEIESYKSENDNLRSQLRLLQEKVDNIETLITKSYN
jgi:hypothetical protein